MNPLSPQDLLDIYLIRTQEPLPQQFSGFPWTTTHPSNYCVCHPCPPAGPSLSQWRTGRNISFLASEDEEASVKYHTFLYHLYRCVLVYDILITVAKVRICWVLFLHSSIIAGSTYFYSDPDLSFVVLLIRILDLNKFKLFSFP